MDIGAVKQQILGRIEEHCRIKGPVVLIDLPGPGIVIGHNQLPPEASRRLADQVNLLGIHAPADLKRPLSLFQIPVHLLKLHQLFQRICKYHSHFHPS